MTRRLLALLATATLAVPASAVVGLGVSTVAPPKPAEAWSPNYVCSDDWHGGWLDSDLYRTATGRAIGSWRCYRMYGGTFGRWL